MSLLDILYEVKEERERQDLKWGEQNHPILDQTLLDRTPQRMCEEFEIPTENRAKQLCDIHAERKSLTFMHILVEEVSEVASCGKDMKRLREELIQVAAVAVAAIQSLDKSTK